MTWTRENTPLRVAFILRFYSPKQVHAALGITTITPVYQWRNGNTVPSPKCQAVLERLEAECEKILQAPKRKKR